MDTRQKIIRTVPPELASQATFVTGFFDPLIAEHAERLAALARPLIVLLADPPDPLLDARSRAELIAGLRSVTAVVMPLQNGEPAIPAGAAVTDERPADLERRRELIAHVHRRHQ